MLKYNPFGYHVYLDAPDLAGSNSNLINAFVAHVKKTHPLWVNISGGSRWEQAMQLCERIRHECGNRVGIILRDIGHDGQFDDGIWSRMSPKTWYELRVVPIKDWLKKFNIVLMTDNESLEADMTAYSQWHAALMPLAYADGVRLTFGRTSDGNPPEHQFRRTAAKAPPMLPMFAEAAKYPVGWFVYSPNNYFGQTAEMNNSRIDCYKRAWDMCARESIRIPVTVLGEFGVLHTTKVNDHLYSDPERGFKHLGWSAYYYANYAYGHALPWVFANGVAACFYCVGLWKNGSLSLDETFFNAVEQILEKGVPLTIPEIAPTQYQYFKSVFITPVHETANAYSKPKLDDDSQFLVIGELKVEIITPDCGFLPPVPVYDEKGDTLYYTHLLPIKKGDGKVAYVDASEISIKSSSDELIPFPNNFHGRALSTIINTRTAVTLRKQPSIDARVIELIYNGIKVEYIPESLLEKTEVYPFENAAAHAIWLPARSANGNNGWIVSTAIENKPEPNVPDDQVMVSKLTLSTILATMEQSVRLINEVLGKK